MSLTVKHLNADTTFLLTFSPHTDGQHPPTDPHAPAPPGSFTVVLDPWLEGESRLLHPKVFSARHRSAGCVRDLSQIPEPNAVIISQASTDHCHVETLRHLNPFSPITTVLAESAAAKKIRNMKHFNPDMVHNLRPFSSKQPDSVIRFCIPPIVPGGSGGEVSISFLQPKIDLSALHNAVAITYLPPSTAADPFPQHFDNHYPITPPESPKHDLPSTSSGATSSGYMTSGWSSAGHSHQVSSASSVSRFSIGTKRTPKRLSVIYSPHGLPYREVQAFASSHLVSTAALPLTLLLHAFHYQKNPWYLGGNVITGGPGGMEIAKNLQARCWISAHDEDKVITGFTVKQLMVEKYPANRIAQEIQAPIDVLNLGVGESLVLKA